MSYLQEDTDMALPGLQAPPAVPQITFLYKLVPGVADRSFGLNVARMAHLPATVVDRAAEQAAHLEQLTLDRARYVNCTGAKNVWTAISKAALMIRQ